MENQQTIGVKGSTSVFAVSAAVAAVASVASVATDDDDDDDDDDMTNAGPAKHSIDV